MIFRKRSQITSFEDQSALNLDNDDVHYVVFKCLGFTLHRQLSYSQHLKEMLQPKEAWACLYNTKVKESH